MDLELDWAAIVVATVAANLLGMAWYRATSARWSRLTQAATGRTNDQLLANATRGAATSLIGWLACAIALSALVSWVDARGIGEALALGGIVWAGAILAPSLPHFAYEGRSWRLQVIDRGYDLAAVLVICIVLELMR